MPILDITDDQGGLIAAAGLRTLACAYFPRKKHRLARDQWFASALATVYKTARISPDTRRRLIELDKESAEMEPRFAESGEEAPRLHVEPAASYKDLSGEWGGLVLESFPDLFKAKQSIQRTFVDGWKRGFKGMVAGLVLTFRMACVQHHERHSQSYKSLELVSRVLRHMFEANPIGAELSLSVSSLEKAWAEFQSVSHVYATVGYSADCDHQFRAS